MLLLGIAIGVLGLIAPQSVRVIYLGAMIIAAPIGWVVSRVLLALLYYFLFTPIALVMRAIGRDRLRIRRRTLASYWTPQPETNDISRYLRQF